MFRKPKRSANKASLRNNRKKGEADEDEDDHHHHVDQNQDDDDDDDERLGNNTRTTTHNTNKRVKKDKTNETKSNNNNNTAASKRDVLHHYTTSSSNRVTAAELATRTAQHHPVVASGSNPTTSASDTTTSDGIYRDKTRNPFLAGPIKASTNVRTTCRFDYQPDICKDYKDTGFCGYGDTCIYLHDRGDTLTGWQIEQQWQEQQKLKQQQQQADMEAFADGVFVTDQAGASKTSADAANAVAILDDGLPFACHICRQPFTDPIVTSCQHYFCERCIVDQLRSSSTSDSNCPICRKDTHGVFNQPTKLLAKKRRLVGAQATWQEFAEACSNSIKVKK